MKYAIKSSIMLAIISMALCSCAVNSTVSIAPKEAFVLGERQTKGYNASIINLSEEELSIVSFDKESGTAIQSLALEPSANAKISVSKYETALFKNYSNRQIQVKVKLSRNVHGMRYEGLRN